MLRFDGNKTFGRRQYISLGEEIEGAKDFKTYRKTVVTYATQINEPFEVDTIEGMHTGKAGDFLAVGPHGEMYPIDQKVFLDSYEEVN